MKLPSRRFLLVALAASSFLASACGMASGPTVGTHTNWAKVCLDDLDCETELSCELGLCQDEPVQVRQGLGFDEASGQDEESLLPLLHLNFEACQAASAPDNEASMPVDCGEGVSRRGASFASAAYQLELPDDPFSSAVTVSAWISPRSQVGGPTLVSRWYLPDQFLLSLSDGRLDFTVTLADANMVRVGAVDLVPVNEWTHAVGVFNGETVALYQNGVLVEELPAPGVLTPTTGPLNIGGYPEWANYDGLIDEVSVYSRALSPAQIEALYQAYLP